MYVVYVLLCLHTKFRHCIWTQSLYGASYTSTLIYTTVIICSMLTIQNAIFCSITLNIIHYEIFAWDVSKGATVIGAWESCSWIETKHSTNNFCVLSIPLIITHRLAYKGRLKGLNFSFLDKTESLDLGYESKSVTHNPFPLALVPIRTRPYDFLLNELFCHFVCHHFNRQLPGWMNWQKFSFFKVQFVVCLCFL